MADKNNSHRKRLLARHRTSLCPGLSGSRL